MSKMSDIHIEMTEHFGDHEPTSEEIENWFEDYVEKLHKSYQERESDE